MEEQVGVAEGEGLKAMGNVIRIDQEHVRVDVDEQGALRPALLEPPMLGTVDLDQLAAAVAAITRLIWARATRLAVLPEAGLDHQLAKRLAGDRDSMTLDQVLPCQGRTEVAVVLADDRNDMLAECIAVASVARPAAPARYETGSAVGPQPFEKPENLPSLQSQQNRRILDPKWRINVSYRESSPRLMAITVISAPPRPWR